MNSEKETKVLYVCDRKACENCGSECSLTADVSHAKNFIRINDDYYVENVPTPKKCKLFKDKCECGHQVYPHMKFCDQCGKELAWSNGNDI